ncbi:TetR/AcrR family transcriptional regulator [Priestia endophytica]|uniref:TetR family transcriptional regulator n=1 Tax=Priestia endophytica TaxID=135735 RepID=A0AAX1Q899_9BACI|nr:TetR/AcrR family transcriptional regulator [Priestia endophytica]RAS77248.1 TetR family transcriptional regulator [Priestia endophytica]
MSVMDRRVLKSQEAIKTAFVELMTEKNFDQITIQDISDRANVGRRTIYHHYMDKFDLLDKLIEEHINELSKLCESAAEMNYIDAELLWFEYFEKNYLFFSTMLASKGASSFRIQFLNFVIEELKNDMDTIEGKNQELSEGEDVTIQFFGAAIVGVVEWWFKNGKPYPPHVMAQRVGTLLEKNL